MNAYRKNAIVVGALFVITMLLGMIDAYFVAPELKAPFVNIPDFDKLLLGAFSVLAMAIGIVFIAIAFFPVLKKHSESIALTYVVFRTIECVLLIVGALCYLYIIALSGESKTIIDSGWYVTAVSTALKIKLYGYQLAMIVLGFGSTFLCYSLFKTKAIPRFLSIWGGIGYICLLLSAVLSICGVIDTTKGLGMVLYIPGGLWELIAFPLWLFIKGFYIPPGQTE
jgi:hypothetical protein